MKRSFLSVSVSEGTKKNRQNSFASFLSSPDHLSQLPLYLSPSCSSQLLGATEEGRYRKTHNLSDPLHDLFLSPTSIDQTVASHQKHRGIEQRVLFLSHYFQVQKIQLVTSNIGVVYRYELDTLTEPPLNALDDGESDFEVVQVAPAVSELEAD